MSQELKIREIFEDYKEIPFIWKTKEYGWAEFVICPIIDNNKIIKVFMYPKQQPEATEMFICNNSEGWSGISFGNLFKYGKIFNPNVYRTHICREHKSNSFNLYVPEGSKSFFITNSLDNFYINWR